MKPPEKAHHVLANLCGIPEDHPYVIEELRNLRLQLEEGDSQHSLSSMWSLLKESVSKKSYRRRSILCITLMAWSNMTGTNARIYYAPTIFASGIMLFYVGCYVRCDTISENARLHRKGISLSSLYTFLRLRISLVGGLLCGRTVLEFMDELFERDTVRGRFVPVRDVIRW
ncbi:hypothetical protein BBP40_003637 [Aspergillus hancockii]|nr:hypothetical protein BBP40_003637 [Aspergillus hancockii]